MIPAEKQQQQQRYLYSDYTMQSFIIFLFFLITFLRWNEALLTCPYTSTNSRSILPPPLFYLFIILFPFTTSTTHPFCCCPVPFSLIHLHPPYLSIVPFIIFHLSPTHNIFNLPLDGCIRYFDLLDPPNKDNIDRGF